jgi:outer membrane protein assembly factor BamB
MVMWGRAASPLIVDSFVVVPGGGKARKNLVAFDCETGSVAWEAENIKDDGTLDQISYPSPSLVTLAGRRQLVIGNESTVSGHDVDTGRSLWSFPWPGHSNGDACNSQAAFVDDQQLLLSKGYSGGAELIEVKQSSNGGDFTANSVWKVPRVLQTKFTNVVIHKGYAYGLSEEILECVDLADGKRKWKSGRFGHGQVLGVGDLLLVLSEEGELSLVKLNPSKFVSHGSIQALEGKTWNNLCLYGKRLLVRNAQEAACFELP